MLMRLLNLIKTKRQGFSLLEIGLAFSVSGVLLMGIWQFTGMAGQSQMASGLSAQALQVAKAAQDYIDTNRIKLLALPQLATLTAPAKICLLTTDTSCYGGVQAAGFLPASFTTANLINTYGQTYEFYIKREDAGVAGTNSGADTDDQLVGLVITKGGTAIPDTLGDSAVNLMAAPGGFIHASSNVAIGVAGGWSLDFSSATGWTTTPGVAGALSGHFAILTRFLKQRAEGTACTSASGGTSTPVNFVRATNGTTGGGSGGTVTTTSFGVSPIAGNTVLVLVSHWGDIDSGYTITDNQGNTYTKVISKRSATTGPSEAAIYMAKNVAASGSAFTISYTNNGYMELSALQAVEISGADTTTPTDQTGTQASQTAHQTGMTVTTGGSTSASNEYAFAVHQGGFDPNPMTTYSISSGWTQGYKYAYCGASACGSFVWKSVPTAASVSATWTHDDIGTNYTDAAAVIATFKGTSSGGAGLTACSGASTPAIAQPSIQIVQSTKLSQATSVNSGTVSFASRPATGNSILVFVNVNGNPSTSGSMSGGSVTDDQGNTYSQVAGTTVSGANQSNSYIFANYNAITNVGSGVTVTVNPPNATDTFSIGAIEVSGLATSAAQDQVSADSSLAYGLNHTITTGSTSQANELAIAFGQASFLYTGTVYNSAGWSSLYDLAPGSGATFRPAISAKLLTATGTVSNTWTFDQSVSNSGLIATFKGASATPNGAGTAVGLGPYVVQKMTLQESSAATPTGSFTSTPTAGNTVIVTVAGGGGSATGFSMPSSGGVTDNQGNSYTRVVESPTSTNNYVSGDIRSYIYYASNVIASGTYTITLHPTSSTNQITFGALEVSGLATASAADQTGTKWNAVSTSGFCGSTAVSAAGSTAQACELAVGVMSADTGNGYDINVGIQKDNSAAGVDSYGWQDALTQHTASSYTINTHTSMQVVTNRLGSFVTPGHTWTHSMNNGCSPSEGVTAAIATFKAASTTCAGAASVASAGDLDKLTDALTLYSQRDMFIGNAAGGAITTGTDNTAVGESAMKLLTTGSRNTGVGCQILGNLSANNDNTAFGCGALNSLATGDRNCSMGEDNMLNQDLIYDNVSIGTQANRDNGATMPGSRAIAIGQYSLAWGSQGSDNIALGTQAGYTLANATFGNSIFIGLSSGVNTNSVSSVAIGDSAYTNTTGNNTVAIGPGTLVGLDDSHLNSLSNNVAVGMGALSHNNEMAANKTVDATYVGVQFITGNSAAGGDLGSKSYNTSLGNYALYSAGYVNPNHTQYNTAVGYNALRGLSANVATTANTALGSHANYYSTSATIAINNSTTMGQTAGGTNSATAANGGITAIGPTTLGYNTTGAFNTGFGNNVLLLNTTGASNTAFGFGAQTNKAATVSSITSVGMYSALWSTTGTTNTALGSHALSGGASAALTGNANTAVGESALADCYGACANNTSVGDDALTYLSNGSTAIQNTAIGVSALHLLTTRQGNTAVGWYALYSATTSDYNTAIGSSALYNVTTGATNAGSNVAIGYYAGKAGTAITTGNTNTFIGSNSQANYNAAVNRTVIGYNTSCTADAMVCIGNTSVSTIAGQVSPSLYSDRRLKQDIHNSDLGMDFIMRLRPVRYIKITGNNRLSYGFIAQELSEALDGRVTNIVSGSGVAPDYYSVAYDQLLSSMVKAIQQAQHQLDGMRLASNNAHEVLERVTARSTALREQLYKREAEMSDLSTATQNLLQQQRAQADTIKAQGSDLLDIARFLQQQGAADMSVHLQPISQTTH